ncbi:MAG TPA: hypothetical protein VK894_02330 [Jiangellales bacterium]|nr:hypothetical protein [Jiangellales bacterium]
MFVQVIRGKAADRDALRRDAERWRDEVAPGADGWLGSTIGIADDGEFVASARFTDEAAARVNSERPEQGAWWAELTSHLAGEPTVHDCDGAETWPAEPSDDAGFVQVIEAHVDDPDRAMAMIRQGADEVGRSRPDVMGGLVALDPTGWMTQVVYFTSEQEARAGEAAESPGADEQMAEMMSMVSDLHYVDLRDPWLLSPVRQA